MAALSREGDGEDGIGRGEVTLGEAGIGDAEGGRVVVIEDGAGSLTIEDGGRNDADTVANGVIRDPGAVAVPVALDANPDDPAQAGGDEGAEGLVGVTGGQERCRVADDGVLDLELVLAPSEMLIGAVFLLYLTQGVRGLGLRGFWLKLQEWWIKRRLKDLRQRRGMHLVDEPDPKDYAFVMNGFGKLKRSAPKINLARLAREETPSA